MVTIPPALMVDVLKNVAPLAAIITILALETEAHLVHGKADHLVAIIAVPPAVITVILVALVKAVHFIHEKVPLPDVVLCIEVVK